MSELENSAALVATKPLNGDEPIAISYGPKSNSKLLGIPREPHVVLCCVVGLSGLLAVLGYQGYQGGANPFNSARIVLA